MNFKTIACMFVTALTVGALAGCAVEPVDEANASDVDDFSGSSGSNLDCGITKLKYQRIDVGGTTLNVGCRGYGPVVVLIHGFPEYSQAWTDVIDYLPPNIRLVVPDLRGYGGSDKPTGVDDYQAEKLVGDIHGLIKAVSKKPVLLVAHDWGGVLSWTFAHEHPEQLRGLIELNGPHPDVLLREIAQNPAQTEAASYIQFFQDPSAEAALAANDYDLLASGVINASFSAEYEAKLRALWAEPGALTPMLNYYRANFGPTKSLPTGNTVDVPTLLLWGLQDAKMLSGNLEGLDEYISDLEIRTYTDASHWIDHERPKTIAKAILEKNFTWH